MGLNKSQLNRIFELMGLINLNWLYAQNYKKEQYLFGALFFNYQCKKIRILFRTTLTTKTSTPTTPSKKSSVLTKSTPTSITTTRIESKHFLPSRYFIIENSFLPNTLYLSVSFRVAYPIPPFEAPNNEHLLKGFWRHVNNYYFKKI